MLTMTSPLASNCPEMEAPGFSVSTANRKFALGKVTKYWSIEKQTLFSPCRFPLANLT